MSDLDEIFGKAIEENVPKKPATSSAKKEKLPDKLMNEGDESGRNDDNLYKLVNDMSIPQKIKLALLGNKTARGMMIKESNRMISLTVLDNGKLTEQEVVDFAKNKNLDEGVFRKIARNTAWMKNYEIKYNLVSNPRMPIDLSMKWIRYLQTKDLKTLGKSRNIPQVIARACLKIYASRQKK